MSDMNTPTPTTTRSRIDEIRKQSQAKAKREQLALVGVLVGAAALFAAILLIVLSQANTTASTQAVAQNLNNAGAALPEATYSSLAPILGNAGAPVMLMEFSNFSCPHCVTYHEEINQMVDAFVRTQKAQFIFQPVIFDPSGDNAESLYAALGAVCAAKQGAFWPMHEALFSAAQTVGSRAFTVENIVQMATTLNLDGQALGTCLQDETSFDVIQKSLELAENLGIQGTPTLLYSVDGGANFKFFDGYPSRVPYAEVEKLVAQYVK